MLSYEAIIGLEVHVELATKSKMFCGCPADYFGHPANSHVCPVCLGLPGTLPVANKKAIENVVLTGIAFGCEIPLFSKFDRKNYFYPDLPKGYQISQYDLPLAKNGKINFEVLGNEKTINIRRVHLEEDTAKMFHATNETLIDFNRSGVPLMEIVTEPELRNAKVAKEMLIKLQQIIRYLGISECDMEKGSMRLEANISLRKIGDKELPNYKVEVKNLNSFRFVEKAIDYEIIRQKEILEKGERVVQETRGYNEAQQKTYSQRIKEEAQDYRYFPEPDLPPIAWKEEDIERIKKELPELPDQKKIRFGKEYQLSSYQANILVAEKAVAEYFDEAAKVGKKYKVAPIEIANTIINKKFNREEILPADLVRILLEKQTQRKIPEEQLLKEIETVISNNPETVEEYRKGKTTSIEFLVGQVMKATKGLADPVSARKLLLEKLQVDR